ncbi:MAG: VWA domain-containing protein [Phycisphaerales bacterium]|nr:VWA domain-containing protein [Phycisphaerales bacterium]
MTTFQLLAWWLLPIAVLAPLGVWRCVSHRRRVRIGFSSAAVAAAGGTSHFVRLRWVPSALRCGAIGLLAFCLARPVIANSQTKVFVEGAAIQFVVDRSGSMRALDFELDGARSNRLDAVKRVGSAFIRGGDGLLGRPDDLVGLIVFARFADSLSPLTVDHGYMVDALNKVQPAVDQSEDGTAIGDAVALGVDRLRDAMSNAKTADGRQPIRSAALILMTDGENNAGDVDPRVAADLAATYGIKIYAIGVGTRGMAPFPMGVDPRGRQIIRNVPVSIDEALLTDIAKRTGGAYFRATDTKSLQAIYEQIDQMEKTTTEQRQSLHFTDLAVQSFNFSGFSVPPFLVGVVLLICAELLLVSTRFRSVN